MKKVLGKLTGLSIVLAMVFNLFMPMMVSAAGKKITFDPNGGKFSDGKTEAQSVTTAGNNATREEIGKYFDVTREGSRFNGWKDETGNVIYNYLESIMDKDITNIDLALKAQWVDQVKLTVKYFEVFDDDRQEPMHMDQEFIVDKDKKVKELSDEVKKAVTADYVGESYELKKVWDYTDVNNPAVVADAKEVNCNANKTLHVLLKKKQYTVKTHSNTQPEVKDTTTEITVEHGKKLSDYHVSPSVSKPGYSFLGWYLEKECKKPFGVDDPITANKEIFAKWGKAYTIVEGANEIIDIRDGEDLVVKADADLSKFKELHIDDKVVPETNYTKTSGSTIITLKVAYLNTLTAGEHTIKFVYTDGEASTKFTIVKGDETPDVNPDEIPDGTSDEKSDGKSPAKVEPSSNGGSSNGGSLGGGSLGGGSYGSGPKTGDAGIAMWGILLSASLVGAAASIKRFRKVK